MLIETIKKPVRDFLAIGNKKVFWIKTFIALILLLLTFGFNIYIGRYVDSVAGPQVPDLLIEHLPVWNSGYLLGPVAVVITLFIFFAVPFIAYGIYGLSNFLFSWFNNKGLSNAQNF